MPLFSTDFVPPATLTLTLEADLDSSLISLSWNQTALAQVDFAGYRVYRKVGAGEWEVVAVYSLIDELSHNDYSVPLNTTITYRVTQSSLDAESAPAEASTVLASNRWWVVSPGNETLTFEIPKVRGVTLTSPKVQDVFSPIGRSSRVVVGDTVQTDDGQITFLVMPDNTGMRELLRAIQARMDGDLLLKAPDGDVHSARIGTITRNYTEVEGLYELTMPFIGAA